MTSYITAETRKYSQFYVNTASLRHFVQISAKQMPKITT